MREAHLFPTEIGPCGLVGGHDGISNFFLPAKDEETLKRQVLAASGLSELGIAPLKSRVLAQIQKHLSGQPQNFAPLKLDLKRVSPFANRVYQALRTIPASETTSYGALATLARAPGASRAVGAAMASNPIPLLIPCHRVIASNGDLGHFSAHGDVATKLRLLTMEGFPLDRLHGPGLRHLRRQDKVLIQHLSGALSLTPASRVDPFIALTRAIVHQQVSTKAGSSIFNKVVTQVGRTGTLKPQHILAASTDQLRGAGLSRQKASYLVDLAEKIQARSIPFSRLATMDDAAVIAALTQVKGIGRWSAQMFLIFQLGRLDVLPLDDLGIKKGFQKVYRLADLPTADALSQQAKVWRPYRSLASRYLWRAAD